MLKGKIIVIEGTDCSGKETQAKILVKTLNENGIKTAHMTNPNYDTPTGKIVGGPYLGKAHICDGYFNEGAANVDPKVAALYYAADRKYNNQKVVDTINKGINIIFDRYVDSNMAHQAGKLEDEIEQNDMINWLDKLEYVFLELPRPDMTIFLYMPYEASMKLKADRAEPGDQHENDKNHLINAQRAYLKLAKKYSYDIINCVDENGRIKSIKEISEEVEKLVFETYYLTCQI